ncbi:MAG: cytochrome c oxidase subunit II [Pseudomonadales bacterium]|nr:cytochrome c oxidase subunit II [Pseudomonadales bacterium]
MQSIAKRSLAIGSALATITTSGAFADLQFDMTPGVTEISQQVFDMHRTMLWWCVAIGVVVFGAMFYSMIKHRKSKGYKASQFHESTAVEVVWTIVPFIILILMAIPATKVLIEMNDTRDSALTVKITGSQWKWHYEYLEWEGKGSPGVDYYSVLSTPSEEIMRPIRASGLFPKNTAQDSYRPDGQYPAQNELYKQDVDKPLVIPTGRKVRFLITSDDVIHSWWVPDFAVKRDAIPGFINELWTQVPEGKEGIYRGQCAELCGKDHAFMPVVVDARSPEEFEQWLADAREAQQAEALAAASSLDKTFTKDELMAEGEKAYLARCSACHQANGQGLPPTFPSLVGSAIATGPVADHIDIVNNGKNAMPGFSAMLTPKEIAAIVTYERNAWGNTPSDGVDVVQPRDVAK